MMSLTDATWGTPTRFVYVESINEVTGDDDRHDPVSSLDSSPSAPSMSTWSIHERRGSPGIRDGDGFQERLHVEENDITLALNVALRDVTTETKEDPEKVAEETFFFLGHAENVSSFKSLQANIDSLAKGVSSPSIQNRPRQGSDASASSQETNYPEVVECFSASTSRSSMTSLASTDSEFDEEELEVVYEVKRAHAQSVEIKKGVLVACRPSTSTSNDILIPDVLPTVVISEPSPLLLSLNEQNFGGSMYSLESSLSTGTTASLGGCNTTPSLSSLTREHSHGTLGSFSTSFSTITRAENDEGCLQPPIPYLMVTRPSDSSIFTTESNASGASVDLNEFPLPPKPVKPSYYSRLMDQVHGRKRVWDNHPADSSVSQRRSTVEQFIMMYSST
ncbi:hypothetical protein FPV67DRAFT_1007072 [Lyophyllum atratum]|nr:hypothetical protein FPV67DRAFT_1007072 [Lyophyllum atratum]